MNTNLFFASTPLHTILSTAIAVQQKHDTNILVFIDQKQGVQNIYQESLENFTPSPFVQVGRLNRHTQRKNKLHTRKQNFHWLMELVDKFQPGKVFTGSDRRIEFQFAINQASKHKRVTGIYVDEGTYSYTTRSASQTISDKYIDSWIKKIVYGFWWKHPPTTGASAWIDQCWMFFPQYANKYLQKKQRLAIQPSLLTNGDMQKFFDKVVEKHQVEKHAIAQLTHLLTLPHESLLQEKDYARYALVIKSLQNNQARVGLKTHPRSHPDSMRFLQDAKPFYTLTGSLAFEAMLAHFPDNLVIVGDISSTLLVAKWFLPQAPVHAIATGNSDNAYQEFLQKIGVLLLERENTQQLMSANR